MTWTWAALMPHPPIIVSEVGRGREKEAQTTLNGLKTLGQKITTEVLQGPPEGLVILAPHQPLANGALFLNTAPTLTGNLARFGAAEVSFTLQSHPELEHLALHLQNSGLPLVRQAISDLTPDHSTLVPLYFLEKLWDRLPPVIVANPGGLSPTEALKLGQILREFGGTEKWALLASGDLSHRLTPEAPGGYDPQGIIFDREVVEALDRGIPQNLLEKWPEKRLNQAGECGFRSTLALMGLTQSPVEMLSYEGPFGVGYACALWRNS